MKRYEFATATAIYDSEEKSQSAWVLVECYNMFYDLMHPREEIDVRVQAWQYVRAYIKMLKEIDHWDYETGEPMPDPKWKELTPNTSKWNTHYTMNPNDRKDMDDYKTLWMRKEKMNNG